jgi:hypothetical protein
MALALGPDMSERLVIANRTTPRYAMLTVQSAEENDEEHVGCEY